jgi:hypothetical protein
VQDNWEKSFGVSPKSHQGGEHAGHEHHE